MADVFISYARSDADFAARLSEGLSSGSLSVWMDTSSMAVGERWTEEIESAIQAAASLVVIVSTASNASIWVRREILYAQQLGKRVVPVLSAPTPLPALLIDRNALALYKDFQGGVDRLIADLARQQPAPPQEGGRAFPRTAVGHTQKALLAFAGIAVLLILGILVIRGGGRLAEALATAAFIGGALLMMAWKADDAINVQFKRDLSLWLVGVDPAAVRESIQRWPTHFAALFDRVFGKKHLAWRCFCRSCIASLVAFVLCALLYAQLRPSTFISLAEVLTIEGGAKDAVFQLVIAVVVVNLVGDYVSLLETRYVLRGMQRSRSVSGQIAWLLVDFVSTAAIFLLWATAFVLVSARAEGMSVRELAETFLYWPRSFLSAAILRHDPVIFFQEVAAVQAMTFWTTYFTSAWLWVYFLAQFVLRLATPLPGAIHFLKYALPIDQRPLRAVGIVMAFLAFVGYCVLVLPVAAMSEDTRASTTYGAIIASRAATAKAE